MRVLLDTHTFLWWLDGDRRLRARARALVADERNEVYVSAASVWEITTKARLGRLPRATAVAADVPAAAASQGFSELSITALHAQRAGSLPGPHRDPFDRMLIAQAQIEELTVITIKRVFERYGVPRLW